MQRIFCSIIFFAAATIYSPATAASVDLSSWNTDGDGNWAYSTTVSTNDTATQSLNSDPTVIHNGINSQGTTLSGKIKVNTSTDDDFVGFVLGYKDGDIANGGTLNTDTDYILFDWKQANQSNWNRGMSLSRVTGDITTCGTCVSSDAWRHDGNVKFLTRSNVVGSQFANVGWSNFVEYTFDILFSDERIKIDVNGITEFDILAVDFGGPFSNGGFGFYNFSQPGVIYSAITSQNVPDDFDPTPDDSSNGVVPVPASLPLLLGGLSLLVGLRRRNVRV